MAYQYHITPDTCTFGRVFLEVELMVSGTKVAEACGIVNLDFKKCELEWNSVKPADLDVSLEENIKKDCVAEAEEIAI